ncbi:MAG: MMPL family transporter [Solirubrobacteraceae bacterium]|nr:MMPL family transporter [Solirubrobacteraceae bacterium]
MPSIPPDSTQGAPRDGASRPTDERRRRGRRKRRVRTSLGPPPKGLGGVAVRSTRVAARFPKTVILLWFVLIAACVYGGAAAGMKEITDADTAAGDSGRADIARTAAGLDGRPTENVMIRTGSAAKTDAIARPLGRELAALSSVSDVTSPYAEGGSTSALRGEDGEAVLMRVELRGGDDDADAKASEAVTKVVDATRAEHPGATVAQTGEGSMDAAIDDIVGDDLARAEMLSLPVTLIVLLLAFGAIVAASVPLALGITAVAGAMGALGVISQLVPNDDSTASLVVLIGLAVGVDYSLFYVRREREERRKGASAHEALERAAASVGRAIIVAGSIVMASLGGLFLSGFAPFQSMAAGTIVVVVAIAVLGSLTVLPAMLALLGDRVDAGRLIGRRKAKRERAALAAGTPLPPARASLLARFVSAVAHRPAPAFGVALLLLVALAYPATGMRLGQGGINSLPQDVAAVKAVAQIDEEFGGGSADADLVLQGRDLGSPAAAAGMKALAREAAKTTGVRGFAPIAVSDDGRTAVLSIPMPEQSPGDAQHLARDLRAALAPVGADLVPGADRVLVGGDAASGLDFRDKVVGAMPLVAAFVLGLALLLLLSTFRSLPLAFTVVGLNLLSVAAAYGVITAVFQNTWAESALGFTSNGSVTTWLPLLAFVILFGLSMDYSILVLERIRELRAKGLAPREAAAQGVAATAGTVTSAAIVMVAVFSIFAMLRLLEMKQLGVGLATAILVDATIVRAIALPAAVALLGDRAFPAAAREARIAARRNDVRKAGHGDPFEGHATAGAQSAVGAFAATGPEVATSRFRPADGAWDDAAMADHRALAGDRDD